MGAWEPQHGAAHTHQVCPPGNACARWPSPEPFPPALGVWVSGRGAPCLSGAPTTYPAAKTFCLREGIGVVAVIFLKVLIGKITRAAEIQPSEAALEPCLGHESPKLAPLAVTWLSFPTSAVGSGHFSHLERSAHRLPRGRRSGVTEAGRHLVWVRYQQLWWYCPPSLGHTQECLPAPPPLHPGGLASRPGGTGWGLQTGPARARGGVWAGGQSTSFHLDLCGGGGGGGGGRARAWCAFRL